MKIVRVLLLITLSLFLSWGLVIIANDFQIHSYRRFMVLSVWIAPLTFLILFLLTRLLTTSTVALKDKSLQKSLFFIVVLSVLTSLLLIPRTTDVIRYFVTFLVVGVTFFSLATITLLFVRKGYERYFSSAIVAYLSMVGVIGFSLFLFMSRFVRMYGDDFCYRNLVLQFGYIPAVIGFYLNWSGRLSSIFLSFAASGIYFGVGAQILLAGFSGFSAAYRFSKPITKKYFRILWSLAVATLIPCLIFALIPDPYKTIYWTVASTDYLPLLILAPLYLLLISNTFEGKYLNLALYATFGFLLSFLLTNTHEVAALPVLFLNALFFIVAFITDRANRGKLLILGLALAGSVLGAAVTILSPGNFVRHTAQAYPQPPGLITLVMQNSTYVFQFLVEILHGQKWLMLFSAFILGYIGPKISIRSKFSALIVLLIVCCMVWLSFLPGVYAAQVQIPPRAQFIPTLFLVMGFFCMGCLTHFEAGRPVILATASIYLLLSIFFFRDLFRKKMDLVTPFIHYAQDWDERDDLLRETDTAPYKIKIPWDSTEQEFNCVLDYYERIK